jgi:PAS domain S-box-containing protein
MSDDKYIINIENGSEDRYTRRTYRELRRIHKELRRQRKGPPSPSPMRYLFWGLFLILWGMLALAIRLDWLTIANLWKAFLVGLGGIFIIRALVSYLAPTDRPRLIGRLIPGIILVFVGLGFLFGVNAWWPVVLVVAGVSVIFISWFLQREIEKRRVTQETLRESEVKYRHIIDNANSVIMEMDTTGNITFINKFALNFFGFREEEILGHNVVGTILTPDASADLENMVRNITAQPEEYLHNEMENRRKDAGKVWMVWTYKPIMDENNNLKEILCTGIDRTQQKKAEELAAREIKEKTAVEERTRLARDLHDAVSQTLFSTSLIAEVLPRLWERNKEEGLKKLQEVRQLTRGALAEMRTLLFELRPAALADADLTDLLRQLAESVIGRARVPVALEIDGNGKVPTEVKIALYRIAQEALNNIAKHSGASQAQVSLHCQPHQIVLQITDNGHGFKVSETTPGSFGLSNMKERAGQIGAVLKIESKIGQGTDITVAWHDDAGRCSDDTTKYDKGHAGGRPHGRA